MITKANINGEQQYVMNVDNIVDCFGLPTIRQELLKIADMLFLTEETKDNTSALSLYILMQLIKGFEISHEQQP